MKYIDAEKLIAEIERYENTAIDAYNPLGEDADFWHGSVVTCENLKTFITSLQQEQPEADLEEEANECWDYVFSAIGWDENSLITMNHKEFLAFARHFYELGLNARKEE